MAFEYKPNVVGFLCTWCAYAAADLAGVSRLQYTTETKIIRVMCTGRVDMAFVLRAFSNGADGVFIGGCWLGGCHYVTEGNYDALFNMHLCRMLMKHIGLNPERLRLEWISASDGIRYAEVMNDFGRVLKELGPLGFGEGIDQLTLQIKLDAMTKMVPYTKLVEGERLRARFSNEDAYRDYFASDEMKLLFNTLLADKLSVSQILMLLKVKHQTTMEISQTLNIDLSDVARHLKSSTRQGMVRYDQNLKCYALA
jgi:F420-non-reducing hydrogenase iron-sulfur subunit